MTRLVLALAAALVLAPGAQAGAPAPSMPAPTGRPAVLQDVLNCRAQTDPGQRLACFDAAAAKMADAESSGQVVVVDREQAREVRRQAFGFNLPSMNLFKGSKEPEMDRVTVKIKSAQQGPRGRWRFVLEDGAIWDQVDDAALNRDPKPGSTAVIRKGALGAFMINVDGQLSLRVRRAQ
jgi:hypothetical protein